MKCWCTIPTPASIACAALHPVTSRPDTSIGAGIGRIDPREDAHERRLAGAVLADERVDLARHHLERRVAHGLAVAEALRDAGHAHGRRAGLAAARHRVAGTVMRPAMMSAADLLDARVHAVGDQRAIVLVVDVADAILREAVLLHAAVEGAVRAPSRSDRTPRRRRPSPWTSARGPAPPRTDPRRRRSRACPVWRAASNTPSPVEPDAWKITFTPCWYWLSASSLPRPGLRNASGVTPAYCAITVQSGQTYFTPARCSPPRTCG